MSHCLFQVHTWNACGIFTGHRTYHSHRNCRQLYFPVENMIKFCLGIGQMIYITPESLAHPLLLKIIPRLSGWVFSSVSSLLKFPLVLKALLSGIFFIGKNHLYSLMIREIPCSFLSLDILKPFSHSLQNVSFILKIAVLFIFCISLCLNLGN